MARILVIEDEEPLRKVVRLILELAGHTVLEAPNGRQGMARWRDTLPELVLTDIFMPDKNGIEVLLEMKNATVQSKIIVMSGGGPHGRFDLNPAAQLLGAERVLVKPFDQQTLLSSVQEVLNGHA